MCLERGVKLVYLPPYSPDLNPTEEFFAELKAFIRRHWQSYADNPSQGLLTSLTGVLRRWEQGNIAPKVTSKMWISILKSII